MTLFTRLTPSRLSSLLEAEAVVPTRSDTGPVFRKSDIGRLELLCELMEIYEMEAEALAVLVAATDQLQSARQDVQKLLSAIQDEPSDVQQRIAAALA